MTPTHEKDPEGLPREALTEEAMQAVIEMMRDPEKALALLPEDESRRYRECQQSIIDAAHWSHPPRRF